MDSYDNIFSVPIDDNGGSSNNINIVNQLDDNWLLGTSTSSLLLPIQQPIQQQHFNSDITIDYQTTSTISQPHFSNDNMFGYQTTTNINNTEAIIPQTIVQPLPSQHQFNNDDNILNFQTIPKPITIPDYNYNIDFNQQIKEQLSLLRQQQEQQQLHIQQQLINFHQQQQQHQFLREPINNDIINPILDQQILNSMVGQTTETNTTTNTTTTTTTTTDIDKKKKDMSKFYHKKHREKKKDYVKDTEDKIAALTFENQQISKDNQRLRESGEGVEYMLPGRDHIQLYNESKNYAFQLKEALDKNDERTLIYILHQYHSSFSKVISFALSDVEKVFNLNVQLLLNVISYVPYVEPEMFDVFSAPDSRKWINLFKIEAELTDEQFLKFEELIIQSGKMEKQLLADRLEFDLQLKRLMNLHLLFLPKNPLEITEDDLPYPIDFSNASISNSKPMDIGQSLEFIFKLNTLKNKVAIGRVQFLEVYSSISQIFTPIQEAKLLVKIGLLFSFKLSHFTMLNHVWKSIMPSKSIFNIAESLEQMINNNNNNNNNSSSSSSSTSSLRPATFNPPNLNK